MGGRTLRLLVKDWAGLELHEAKAAAYIMWLAVLALHANDEHQVALLPID